MRSFTNVMHIDIFVSWWRHAQYPSIWWIQ